MRDWLPTAIQLDGFAWPWLLLALPLPLLVRWLLPARKAGMAGLRVPFGDRLASIAGARGSLRSLHGTSLFHWLAWGLLCIAAARPQVLGDPVQPPQEGRDVMLAVDLSGSMSEEDMRLGGRSVDRLTAAKAVLADFIERRTGDRLGLIVFGQKAYVLTPLTLDHDTVRSQLGDTLVGLAGRETAIGDAIGLGVKRLHAQPNDQRVLILLTDGVNTAGALDPAKAAELARDEGVRIHTIAFGGDGQSVSFMGMQIQLPGMAPEMDEAGLRAIADTTGGKAFRARDTRELAGIYAEIDRLEPVQRPGEAVRPRLERYAWPLGLALACGVLGMLFTTWRRAA